MKRDPSQPPKNSVLGRLAGGLKPAQRRTKVEARRLAIDSGATWTRALLVDRAAGRVTITRVCDEQFAADAERPSVRELLGVAGMPAIVALAREESLLGRVEFPTDDEADLRGLARMAAARDFSVEGTETLSDFQRTSSRPGATQVVIAAATRARVDDAAARAGAPVARVSMRALGMLALIRASDTLRAGSTLAIDATREQLECSLVRDGELMHSRGVTLAVLAPEQRAAAILVEFRRLLAALRASGEAAAIDRVVIAAESAVAAVLVPQAAAIAGCSATRLDAHPRIGFASPDVREQACATCLPLAGLLLEDEAATDPAGNAVDLLHPTPLIDVAARARQRALMVAGVMLVAAFAGWTFGARSWQGLEAQREDLLAKARNSSPLRNRYKRDDLRVKHIEAYARYAPRWLEHFEALRRFAPDPSQVVLDALDAQLDLTNMAWADTGKANLPADQRFAMTATPTLRFTLDGEAADRATADGLRDALVKDKGYALSSAGADARGGRRLPYPFAYTLRTGDLAPRQAGEGDTKSGGAKSSEAAP